MGNIGVPFRISKKRTEQSKQQIMTYLAQTPKFTTGDPMYVSHLFSTDLPEILHSWPACVCTNSFCTCKSTKMLCFHTLGNHKINLRKLLTSTSMLSHFFDASAVYGVALAMKTLRRTIVFSVDASMVGSVDATSIDS